MSRSDVKNNRIGEAKLMACGNVATIIEYSNNKCITVKFDNGEIIECIYVQFKKGTITSKYTRTIYNVGYLGEGKYKVKHNNNLTNQYKTWVSMIRRCYSEVELNKEPSYIGCSICEEWLNYQNFAQWYDENYYEIDNEVMEIDKDIIYKGNKLYSPNTCIFVPSRINCLFTKTNAKRGDYPIGVKYHKRDNVFESCCSNIVNNKKKTIYIGRFNNPIDAFYKGYKPFKESYIKEVAEEYKDKIPERLYNAMMNYIVEITD